MLHSMSDLTQNKLERVTAALDDGIVMLHVDGRCEGVSIPAHLMGDPDLRLNIAYGFGLPTLDLDDDGIYAVLSFGGVNHGCTIPWDALFGITQPEHGSRGSIWPASVPAEALARSAPLGDADRVDFGEVDEKAPETETETEPKPRQRGHLRLVKG